MMIAAFAPTLAVGGLLAYLLFQFVYSFWRLKDVPGPFWAKFTELQRVSWVKTGRAQEIHQEVHQKHGDLVRFGPNVVSISDPAAIPTVYPMRPGFPKGKFYKVLMPFSKNGNLPAVFNSQDENLHKQIKSPIAPLFSQSNTVTYERFVDEVLDVLFKAFDERFAGTGRVFDFGTWLQYFAFDVMGTLTFSKRYGFLENGTDVKGMLETIWNYMSTAAPITQIPWYDEWWIKNPWVASLRKPFGFGILGIVGDFVAERQKKEKDVSNAEKAEGDINEKDMLARFIEIQKTNPNVPDWCVTAWTFSNVLAGSDSTGSVLKTTWFNLLTHPETLQKLRDELLEAESNEGLTRPYPKWNEVRELPYLDACINEGARLHPPFCLPFERVVPKEGVTICGRFFEGGTVVGMSPYVVNRHKPTFGEDADEWRPERWLGHDAATRKKLDQAMLTFGAGRRICLGKNVALLEMKKLVPALVLNYDVEIVDPSTFTVENGWFFRQKGLNARIQRREVKA